MKYIYNGAINLLVGILLCTLVLVTSIVYTPTYEYTIIFSPDYEESAIIDYIGDEGWEIISARRATDQNGEQGYEFVIKK